MQLNTLNEPADMFFNLTESPWIRAGRQYFVRVCRFTVSHTSCTKTVPHLRQDLWSHTNNGTAIRNFTAYSVPPHGVVALLLRDAGNEPPGTYPPCARPQEWCMSENGTLIGQ
jgi:alpha-galactosidase